MKKNILIGLAVIISVVAVGAMIYASVKLNKQNNEEDTHLLEVSVAELQEKVANKESFVLVMTQTFCDHCKSYKPKLKKLLTKHDLVGYYIEIDLLSDEDLAALRQISNTEGSGTPTTVFIVNGEEQSTYNRIVGDAAMSKVENRLKQLGFIS